MWPFLLWMLLYPLVPRAEDLLLALAGRERVDSPRAERATVALYLAVGLALFIVGAL